MQYDIHLRARKDTPLRLKRVMNENTFRFTR